MILENGRVDNITHDIFREVIITQPKNIEGMDVHDYMVNLNWDDLEFVKSVEELRKLGYHYMHCSAPGGKKIHTTVRKLIFLNFFQTNYKIINLILSLFIFTFI